MSRAGGRAAIAATVAGVSAAIALLALDRLLKTAVVIRPAIGGIIVVGWLNFRGAENPALAFSLPFPKSALVVVSLGAIIFFTGWWMNAMRRREIVRGLAVMLIVAGASSNLYDRLRFGYVIDYLDMPWFTVFNLADAMISAGVGLLVLQELVRWWRTSKDG